MRIGIYPRKSVYRDNSESISVQVKMCKDYANIIYCDEPVEFVVYDKDEGFSGKNQNRPSLQQLIDDIHAGLLNVIMVYKIDRLGRNFKEFVDMYHDFSQYDVSFISVKESFDTSTPIGRTIMYTLAAWAEYERDVTSIRVSDNMLALAAAGRWTGGKIPTGMKSFRTKAGNKVHSFLEVDHDTVWRVKFLYELILDGYSITGMERYCRDNGIRSQSGKFLNTSQIYGILTNPVYCQNSIEAYRYLNEQGCSLPDEALFDGQKGLMSYGKTRTGTTSQNRTKKNSWTISVGIHDYVIRSDQWIAVQNRLGIGKQLRTRIHEAGILNGTIYCQCGSKMRCRVYTKNAISFSYYYCDDKIRKGPEYVTCSAMPSFIRVEEIDDKFLSYLKNIRLSKNLITIQEESAIPYDESSTSVSIKQLDDALQKLTASLAAAEGSVASKYIIAEIEKLDQERELYNRQLAAIKTSRLKKQDPEAQREEIYHEISQLITQFKSLTYREKNETVKKIVKKVILHTDQIVIHF